jgi:hypothetical protein
VTQLAEHHRVAENMERARMRTAYHAPPDTIADMGR